MKPIRQILFYLIFIVVTINLSSFKANEDLPKGVVFALKTGNAQSLASFFNHHVELVVVGNSDVYSKYQSQIILKSFFRRNEPSSFRVLQRSDANSKVSFAIGRLSTSNGKYKVYILGKGTGKNYKIHQLRIEKDYG